MKLRYMFLFLVALVLAPVTTSHATETTQGGEEYNPDAPGNFNDWQIDPKNELLEFDGQGRVRSGVVYITYHDGANITMYVFNLTADNGGFLYISKYGSNSDYKILSRDSEGVFSGSTYSGTMTCCRCSGVMPGSEDEKSCYHIDENTDFSLFAWYHVYDLEKDSVRSTYLPTTTPASGREVYSFYTNIPIFTDPNSDELTNYVENGDYSGASNASDVDEAKKAIYPDNKYENEKGPYLDVESFDGSNLTIRPAKDAFCTWTYTPKNTDLYSDLTLDVLYDYQLSYQIGPSAAVGYTDYFHGSGTAPLSDYNFSFNCHPTYVATDYNWCRQLEAASLMFGGKVTESVGATWVATAALGTDIAQVTGSFLTITFRLKGKYKGDWVYGQGVIEKVDLINRTCTELHAVSDEDGNYTVDEEEEPITRDENGDVVINNNVSGGGGSSSSATGGNANVTIGDITSSSTFRFPDKITVDLNVKGLDGSGGGSSGSSSDDGEKKWYDRILDAISSLLEFLTEVLTKLLESLANLVTTFADTVGDFIQYLFEGFGLFSGDMDNLLQENLSFLPPQVWKLIMFGICTVILTAIVKKFFG